MQIRALELVNSGGQRAFEVSWHQDNAASRVRLTAQPGEETFDLGARGAGHQTARVFACDGVSLRFELDIDGSLQTAETHSHSPREWTVFLVQHTHTDIGYTDIQDTLYDDHVDFIREACRLIEATNGQPDGLRFKWTCEAAWAVERFFQSATPEEIERFRRCVADGAIEVTGMWWQWTELCSHMEWARQFEWAAQTAQKARAKVTAAMQCDVNGFSWSLPQLLREYGIGRFCSAINWYRGGAPEPCPRPFFWEAPDGSRVLAYNGHHYHVGNALGLHENLATVEDRLPQHLRGLIDDGYSYKSVLLQSSGAFADNSPPSRVMADIAAQWNQKYLWPRLRVATLSEFFDSIESEFEEISPITLRGDWTDWWADGNASAPREVAENREAQENIRATGTLWAFGALKGRHPSEEERRSLHTALCAAAEFDEHTWGAAESSSAPYSPMTQLQWKRKSANADKAAVLSQKLLTRAVSGQAPSGNAPAVVVCNTESWRRREAVTVKVDIKDLPGALDFHILDADTGRQIPHQIVDHTDTWAEIAFIAEVEGFGATTYPVVAAQLWNTHQDKTRPGSEARFWRGSDQTLRSGRWEVSFDPISGEITSLRDTRKQERLFVAEGPYRPLDLIYERPQRGRAQVELGRSNRGFAHHTFDRIRMPWRFKRAESGPVFSELARTAAPAGTSLVSIEQSIRMYHETDALEVTTHLVKQPQVEAEALYLAFPFDTQGPVTLDKALTWFEAGQEQLPGTARDWYTVHSWMRAGGGGPILCSMDAPMAQIGGIQTGQWSSDLPEPQGLVMSWLYNNYWATNFPASAHGPMIFRHRIYPAATGEAAEAVRCGLESRNPLRAVFVHNSGAGRFAAEVSFESDGIFIVDMRIAEDSEGIAFRLWNPCATSQSWSLRLGVPVEQATVHGALYDETAQALTVSEGALCGTLRGRETCRLLVTTGQ